MSRIFALSCALLLCACATQPRQSPSVVAPVTVATATAADTASPAVPMSANATASPATAIAADAPSTRVPANDNLNAVAWTQTAVEHNLIYREVYRNAREKLLRALRDPARAVVEIQKREGHRHQRDIDERPGGDAPERGARSLRRGDIGDAAKRPEHNLVRAAADLTAGERVAELVHQDDQEQRQILQGAPHGRVIEGDARGNRIEG